MKVTVTKDTEFVPVTLTIKLETQQELDACGAMTNSTHMGEILKALGVKCGFDYEDLANAGADIETDKLHAALIKAGDRVRQYHPELAP